MNNIISPALGARTRDNTRPSYDNILRKSRKFSVREEYTKNGVVFVRKQATSDE